MAAIGPNTPVQYLKGVGPKVSSACEKLEIRTVGDLLKHFPSRYEDFSKTAPIGRLAEGENATIRGTIKKIASVQIGKGRTMQRGVLANSDGEVGLIWFNQPFLAKTIIQKEIFVSGKISLSNGKKTILSPVWEPAGDNSLHTGRIVPIYPETKSISSKKLRAMMKPALETTAGQIKEILPEKTLKKHHLLPRQKAFFMIHFPKTAQEANRARKRFAFEEMFFLQMQILFQKKLWQEKRTAFKIPINKKKIKSIVKKLPFGLTGDQKRSLKEILIDMEKSIPMNRLLQGDVGSGKTIPAILAAANAIFAGRTALLMAPTNLLALQHYQTAKKILSPFKVKIRLLSGGKKTKSAGGKELIIGTHALLHQKFDRQKIGMVIIDEQHRFGVRQRAKLANALNPRFPHLLTMTATPIPRTISLVIQGNLDISRLKQMPKGRQKISTFIVPDKKRSRAYRWIAEQIKANHSQAFIICPFLEQSETLKSIKSAKKEFAHLQKQVFPNLKLSLLHGKTSADEKEKILKKMQAGLIDILVATPIVEVGIDIANADIMVIESAERFGLSQLHQLRGRVGRRKQKAYCFLFANLNGSEKTKSRLRAMETISRGEKLAEIDLRLRGPGEVYGSKQHGFSRLKLASILDFNLVKRCRQEAEEVIANDHLLKKNRHLREMGEKIKLAAAN